MSTTTSGCSARPRAARSSANASAPRWECRLGRPAVLRRGEQRPDPTTIASAHARRSAMTNRSASLSSAISRFDRGTPGSATTPSSVSTKFAYTHSPGKPEACPGRAPRARRAARTTGSPGGSCRSSSGSTTRASCEELAAQVGVVLDTAPRQNVVTVREPSSSTPRICVQRCAASRCTATPRGSTRSTSVSAICSPIRSCTVNRRAYSRTRRVSFEMPMISLAGDVRDVRRAVERQRMVLAEGVERDRPLDDLARTVRPLGARPGTP